MENWRIVWRDGIAPQLSTAGLAALQEALSNDDERLVQGATTTPPPLQCMRDCPAEGACAVGYGAWQGDGLETVGDVEEFFVKICSATDQHFGEPTACRWFLNWFDDTPRDEMRRLLLPEVAAVLAERCRVEPEDAPPMITVTAAA